jgi:hypothetical protein
MFAIDAAHEALFEMGWPHLRVLVAPHPHEKEPAKWAAKAIRAYDPNVYHVEWPREVAYRFVRAMGAKRPKGPRDNIVYPDPADADRLLEIAGPVDEKEARAIVAHVTHPQSCHKERSIEDLLFLLEAMVGGEPILDEALKRYEAMSKKELDFGNPHDIVYVAYWSGFLLARLPDEKKKKHAARIEKLIATARGTSVGERLLMVAHGVKGIEESGWRPGIHIAHYANDPEFLVKHADMGPPDMQIAYRAKEKSEKVLEVFAKRQRKIEAWRLPFWVDELSVVASPKATEMLKDLAGKKAVSEKVAKVLAERSGKQAKTTKAAAKPVAKKKAIADAEKRFDELSRWLAAELKKVRGNKKKEALVLEEATNRYADIRTDIGEDPREAIVHFFAADGCGYGKHREPAFLRVGPTDAELKRWIDAIS